MTNFSANFHLTTCPKATINWNTSCSSYQKASNFLNLVSVQHHTIADWQHIGDTGNSLTDAWKGRSHIQSQASHPTTSKTDPCPHQYPVQALHTLQGFIVSTGPMWVFTRTRFPRPGYYPCSIQILGWVLIWSLHHPIRRCPLVLSLKERCMWKRREVDRESMGPIVKPLPRYRKHKPWDLQMNRVLLEMLWHLYPEMMLKRRSEDGLLVPEENNSLLPLVCSHKFKLNSRLFLGAFAIISYLGSDWIQKSKVKEVKCNTGFVWTNMTKCITVHSCVENSKMVAWYWYGTIYSCFFFLFTIRWMVFWLSWNSIYSTCHYYTSRWGIPPFSLICFPNFITSINTTPKIQTIGI